MEHNKVINGRRYFCRRVPVMKQLKLLPLLGHFLKDEESDEADIFDLELEPLFKLLVEHSKMRCENVQVGDVEIEAELLPHLDDHFEELHDFIEVMVWAMRISFEGKKKVKKDTK